MFMVSALYKTNNAQRDLDAATIRLRNFDAGSEEFAQQAAAIGYAESSIEQGNSSFWFWVSVLLFAIALGSFVQAQFVITIFFVFLGVICVALI